MISLFSITSLKTFINFLHFSSSSPVRGSNVYSIQRASKDDEGSYICKAKSAAGEMEEVLQVIVSEDANIVEEVCSSMVTVVEFLGASDEIQKIFKPQ